MLRLMAAVHNVGVVLTGEDITGAANIGVSRNRANAGRNGLPQPWLCAALPVASRLRRQMVNGGVTARVVRQNRCAYGQADQADLT